MRISVAVTPGIFLSWADGAPATSSAPASATMVRVNRLRNMGLSSLWLVRFWSSRRQPADEQAQRARDAGRHRIHEADQEHAVDRPRRGLRDVIGDVGDILDEQRA